MSKPVAWVVGRDGTLGRSVVETLERRGYLVPADATWFDVRDQDAVREGFARWHSVGDPAALFHCAVHVELALTEQDPATTAAVNELGLIHVFRALHELKLAPWVCAVSSGHCYAPVARPALLDEAAPVTPRSAYALSKLNAEGWATRLGEQHGMPVFIPRVFSFTAAWQRPAFVVPRLAQVIKHASAGAEIRTGWLDAYRDFLAVPDVASALVLAHEKGCRGVMNVCSGKGLQIRSVADAFLDRWRAANPGATAPRLVPGPPRADDVEWMVGDPGRFRQATEFRPEIPWDQTLRGVWDAVAPS